MGSEMVGHLLLSYHIIRRPHALSRESDHDGWQRFFAFCTLRACERLGTAFVSHTWKNAVHPVVLSRCKAGFAQQSYHTAPSTSGKSQHIVAFLFHNVSGVEREN